MPLLVSHHVKVDIDSDIGVDIVDIMYKQVEVDTMFQSSQQSRSDLPKN